MNLNKLAGLMANHLALATELEKEKIDTLLYGMEIILCVLIKGMVLFSLAYALGVLPHAIVALATAAMFRMLTGGAHCSSYGRCLSFGLVVYLSIGRLSLGVEKILFPVLLVYLSFLVTFTAAICTVRWAPGEVPYRLMKGQRERNMFKLLSLLYMVFWLGLIIYFIGKAKDSVILAAVLALAIQTASFTPWGYWLITRADRFMAKLTTKGGDMSAPF